MVCGGAYGAFYCVGDDDGGLLEWGGGGGEDGGGLWDGWERGKGVKGGWSWEYEVSWFDLFEIIVCTLQIDFGFVLCVDCV